MIFDSMRLKKGDWFYLLVFSSLTILVATRVAAVSVGVSPGIYEVDFQPNYEGDFGFTYNLGAEEYSFDVYAEGDLAKYVTLNKNSLTSGGMVTAHLELPSEIETPGPHRLVIWATPNKVSLQKSGGGLGAVLTVGGVIKINVPYPGKYIDLDFEILDINEGEKTPVNLKIYSRGIELVNTNSKIEILDFSNKTVGTFQLGSNSIDPADFITISSELDTSEYGSGNYRAILAVDYDGEKKIVEKKLKIGELYVGITNYTAEVEKNKINPFYVEVESFWNDPIENVYAEVKLPGKDVSFSTSPITLPAWQKGTLQGYFDTTGIEEDRVEANVSVHYGGKTTEKLVNVQLGKGKYKINYLIVLLGGVILLFILIFIWFYFKLKKLEKKGGKKG